MNFLLLGLNHKTAPIELRERMAIAPAALAEATRTLLEAPDIREGLILSTCNRVELLVCHDLPIHDLSIHDPSAHHSSAHDPSRQHPSMQSLLAFIERYFEIDPAQVSPHLYEYRDADAIRHLFRVAGSLDSMVIGEPQILGQVKESYFAAKSVGAAGADLEKLLQRTFAVAKRIRNETEIGANSVSIASVAVELAQKVFGSLEEKTILLVGAGEMSELAARHLMERGAGTVLVANRTPERAQHLAQQFGGRAIPFEDLYRSADQADIIITSTGASRPIFRKEHAQQFLQRRRSRPIFFVDIAVPRDVDPAVNRLDGVFLYDIDDLQSVALSHLAERSREAELAEAIVAAEVDQYQQRLHVLNVVPEIIQLQRLVEGIRNLELRRMESRLQVLSPEQQETVEALTRSLANKFLHHPLQAIKQAAKEGDLAAVEAIRRAFGLHLSGRYGIGEDAAHGASQAEAPSAEPHPTGKDPSSSR